MYCRLVQKPNYLGLKQYKKAKKSKHFNHLRLANRSQSFSTYHTISPTMNWSYLLNKYNLVM